MKRMRIVGLCLVAVFAFSAFAVSSASALPEIGRCVAKPGTGKYKNSNCTEKAGSKVEEKQFERVKNAVKKGFTSAGGEGVLETAAGTKVVCTAQSATGEYLEKGATPSTKEVHHVVATFTGCTLPLISAPCNTAGKASGEIVTNELEGKMGYISGKGTKTPVVGQELKPQKNVTSKLFAAFECGAGAVKIEVGQGTGKGGNCIIAPVEPANVMSTNATETYSGSGGKQSPQSFEGSTKVCNLESRANGGAWERATQALVTTITNEEELEIFA